MASRGATRQSTTTPREIVARNIRRAREEQDLTQAELAIAIGLRDGQTVSNWERGLYSPSDTSLAGLAHVLRRPLAWFYTDHEESVAA